MVEVSQREPSLLANLDLASANLKQLRQLAALDRYDRQAFPGGAAAFGRGRRKLLLRRLELQLKNWQNEPNFRWEFLIVKAHRIG